jgi:hypothetical protein
MIVVIAGMPRSGSTFSFNIARELLLSRGTTAWGSANSLPPAQALARTEHFILKSHNPDAQVLEMMRNGHARAVCTYRKPEDAVASWSAAFGFSVPDSISTIRSWLEWHGAQRHAHDIDYEQIETDPLSAIVGIGGHLLGEVSVDEAGALLHTYKKSATFERVTRMEKNDETVDLGFSYYDPQSFYHRRHVRSLDALTAEETLSESDLSQVRQALAAFVGAAGRYIPPARVSSGEASW